MKKVLVLLLAATFGMAGTALAFHDGGVADCEGCHTMHNSYEGAAMDTDTAQFTTGPMLLQGTDRGSACLNCHGEGATNHSYHVSTSGITGTGAEVPAQLTPGGDFSWILAATADSDRRGHNIVAADFGYAADVTLTAAPGGTYSAANFTCASCHDPHGQYRVNDTGAIVKPTAGSAVDPIKASGSYDNSAAPTATEAVGVYRLLAGSGYQLKSAPSEPAFTANPPVAIAPSTYNTSAGGGGARVAYGSGMSEWCANCHGSLHNDDYPTTLRHPAGNNADLGTTIAANYNDYVKSGDLTGVEATSYLPLVPFETGQGYADRAALATLTGETSGANEATGGDNVMCLSCHRAHASGFNSMLRWDVAETFIAENGAYTPTPGTSDPAQMSAAYYEKPATDFATYQRSLCNKCHVKD